MKKVSNILTILNIFIRICTSTESPREKKTNHSVFCFVLQERVWETSQGNYKHMHILQTDILSNVTLQLILDSKPLWKWTTHSTQLCFIFTSMVKTKTLLSIKTALEKIWLGMYTYSNCFKRAKDSKNIQ